jgi:3-oxoacyl-[acyl-carrier protein] reductase
MQRVALVTGGTRGIGAGIALRLAKDGFSLALTGLRSIEEVQPLLATLREAGIDPMYVQADVRNYMDRDVTLRAVEDQFGRLDVLVNNAGVAPTVRADILDATEESFNRILAINLKGPYFLTQAVARWMIRQAETEKNVHRAIINVGSVSAVTASVNRGDYCISKAGVAMSTKLWAVRLAEFGIAVYEVRPGIIATDMTKDAHKKYEALIENGLLLEKRWGTPEDVGCAVSLLANGLMPYAPGAVLVIDGGMSVPRL